MISQNTSTKKKKAGRPVAVEGGRKVNLYLGEKHYNHAKRQRRAMSEYIRSLIERDIMQQQKMA